MGNRTSGSVEAALGEEEDEGEYFTKSGDLFIGTSDGRLIRHFVDFNRGDSSSSDTILPKQTQSFSFPEQGGHLATTTMRTIFAPTHLSDSRLAFAATNDLIILNFDKLRQGRSLDDSQITFKGHRRPIVSFSLLSSSNLLASGSLDSTIRLWKLFKGERFTTCLTHIHVRRPVFWVDRVVVGGATASTEQLVSCDSVGVSFWDLERLDGRVKEPIEEIKIRPVRATTRPRGCQCCSVLGKEAEGGGSGGVSRAVVTGSNDGSVQVWARNEDSTSWRNLVREFKWKNQEVISMAKCESGSCVVTGGRAKLAVWDIRGTKNAPVVEWTHGDTESESDDGDGDVSNSGVVAVRAIDGGRIASCSMNGSCRIWSLPSGKKCLDVFRPEPPASCCGLCFVPDGMGDGWSPVVEKDEDERERFVIEGALEEFSSQIGWNLMIGRTQFLVFRSFLCSDD